MSMNKQILIVGAGFSGVVIARNLAEKGYQIKVIDNETMSQVTAILSAMPKQA